MFVTFDEKGQAFAPFRMLIGAVFAMLILVIIISAINYFSNLENDISKQNFFKGITNATLQPNGETLVIKNLKLSKDDAFSARGLANQTGLGEDCFDFVDSGSLNFEILDDALKVKEATVTDVFIKCETNIDASCSSGCEVCCELSFGVDSVSE